eukprot:1032750-Ditylum_brightwellii.AAC.1
MSLSMLCGNFKPQDAEQGTVHKQQEILFVPKEESTEESDKVEIILQLENPEELINWRIHPNHVIQNNLCKLLESWFNMAEILLEGEALHYWRQFKPQVMGLLIFQEKEYFK